MGIRYILLIAFTAIFFSGCSSHISLKPNQEYITKFQNQKSKNSEKTVYMINLVPGKKAFECNNKRYIVKANEYISCKLDKINTIAVVTINPGLYGSALLETEYSYPSIYRLLDYTKEKELFYVYYYDTSISPAIGFKKISKEIGMSLIGNPDLKKTFKISDMKATGYEISLFNPSLVYYYTGKNLNSNKTYKQFLKQVDEKFKLLKREDLKRTEAENSDPMNYSKHAEATSDASLRKEASDFVVSNMSKDDFFKLWISKTLTKIDNTKVEVKNPNTSKIIVYRSKDDNGIPMGGIWTKEQYMGAMLPNSYIEILSDKSKITLYSKYGNMQHLTLSLLPGKTYYVEADSEIGWSDIYTSLTKRTKQDFLNEKIDYKIALDKDKIDKVTQERIDKALTLFKDY